ncbi:Gfo/Idh/MocA family protein [Niabella hirudinis]|uniref:Gfo/Idh/MocA family protein n=1 Tax=Niabella hirudinis TaxID=1285929 RepID=UPI003EB88BED
MAQKSTVSRRSFLSSATALSLPLVVGDLTGLRWPGTKLKHVCIGVGGMGWGDLQNFKQHPDVMIVALCDTDAANLKKAAELFPEARTYNDWRVLFAKEKHHFDSVNVSVPDHNHYIIAINAIKLGKHVYCQKPLCHDVAEVRALTRASVKKGVVTQLGTQYASGKGDRTAVQWIKKGLIGKVQKVYLCSNRSGIEAYRIEGPRPSSATPVPEGVNWEVWIGTAPMRPYAADIYHPAKWRSWQDFGTGWSGDIGCHIFDAVWKGLGLKAPLSVKAEVQPSWQKSPARRADTWPQGNHITWQFPGNELTEKETLQIEWFDGQFYPPLEVQQLYNGKYPEECALLVGTKGALLIPHQLMPVLLPENQFKDQSPPMLEDRNHYHHFVDACLRRVHNESYFAQTGPMTEAILLGTIAIRVPDTLLEWDAAKMQFPSYPAANAYIKRRYRKGWEAPEL